MGARRLPGASLRRRTSPAEATLHAAALVVGLGLACVPSVEPVRLATAAAHFHCAMDARCPELPIDGAAPADAFFRGIGDPSLEYDPEGDTLWLAYSWLDVVTGELAIRTQLARSEDRGRTFSFVSAANAVERRPDARGRDGLFVHEVPTLARAGPGDWRLLWLRYFDPLGGGPGRREHAEPVLLSARADDPRRLGAGAVVLPRPAAGEPALADCVAFTEPALLAEGGELWLAASCVVLRFGRRRPEDERLVLWHETGRGFVLVGTLLDGRDARALGGDRIEQADLARARDGTLLLLATPIRDGSDTAHQGCVVLEVEDLATARLRRDEAGLPYVRLRLTADGSGLGPGMCSYDAASETGVLLVVTRFALGRSPPELVFSLRRTGVHP